MALISVNQQLPGGFGLFLLVPVAGVVAALCAVPLAWISLRTRGHAFVVITLIAVFIFQLLAFNLRGITLGSTGIFLPASGFALDWYFLPYYYVQLAILVLALLISWYIRSSRYGLWLLAIRDDEDRAEGLGVRTGASKLSAFVISAFFTGMIGAMYAYFIGSIYPQYVFDPALSITLVLMAFLGGVGTLSGPVVGALILEICAAVLQPQRANWVLSNLPRRAVPDYHAAPATWHRALAFQALVGMAYPTRRGG